MQNLFVPYEQALELKQLGFDEPCFGYYENGYFIFWYDSIQDNELILNCTAPIYQQAFRWFRDKYRLSVQLYEAVKISDKDNWSFRIRGVKNYNFFYDIREEWDSYEEAELECLVKLIDIVKKQNLKG
jgi:hypothetical protein